MNLELENGQADFQKKESFLPLCWSVEQLDNSELKNSTLVVLVATNPDKNQIVLKPRSEGLSLISGKGAFDDTSDPADAAMRELRYDTGCKDLTAGLKMLGVYESRYLQNPPEIVALYEATISADTVFGPSKPGKTNIAAWTDLQELSNVEKYSFEHLHYINEWLSKH